MSELIKTPDPSVFRWHPVTRGLFLGAINVFIMLGFDLLINGGLRENWVQCTLLLCAFGFLSIPILDGASIARKSAKPWSKDGWMYVYAAGSGFAIPVSLVVWGTEVASFTFFAGFLAAGLVFGLLNNLMFGKTVGALENIDTIAQHYKTDETFDDKPFRKFMYYAWPFLAIGLLALLVVAPPEDGWRQIYIPIQMVVLCSLTPHFHPKTFVASPAILGLAFLIAAVFSSF